MNSAPCAGSRSFAGRSGSRWRRRPWSSTPGRAQAIARRGGRDDDRVLALQERPGHVRTLIDGVRSWLEEREYASVEQKKGSVSRQNGSDPEAYERANYIKMLTTFIRGAI